MSTSVITPSHARVEDFDSTNGNQQQVAPYLTIAVLDGGEATVHALLQQGYNVNEQDDLGLWPLLAAVKCNNMDLARLLIDHGARSQQRKRKRGELHALAECQKGPFPPPPSTAPSRWVNTIMQSWMGSTPASIKFWQLLLSVGAKPDWQDQLGITPFHLACARGNWPAVQFLLQAKHINDVNHADKAGQTGLHFAAHFGHAAVVSLLLANRADPHALSKHGDAAEVARRQGHTGVAEMIESWSYRACPVLFMPMELLHYILAQLEPHDLCAVAQVCSTLNEVSSADCLWRRFCSTTAPKRESNSAEPQKEMEMSCKQRYMAWVQPRLKQYARFRSTPSNALQPPPNQGADRNYDYLLKMNIVGDAGVGKTQIHNRFIHGSFQAPYVSTIGVEFGIRTVDLLGLRFKLQVWDTAGQERFRTISRAYYRGSKGVMLVYDITCRPSWDNIRRWADEVRRSNEEVAFFLVGTKSDLAAASRQVTPEEGRALADELGAVGWLEVSSLTGVGVDEAFFHLVEATTHDLNPFSLQPGLNGGWSVPQEQLLEQLFAMSPTGREMAASSSSTKQTCLVQ